MKDIANHLFDIFENSVNAGASEVIVRIANTENHFFCSITDNGTGISGPEVLDPFVTSRKTRRVGLGLPLLKKAAEDTGGYLKIKKREEMRGTTLQFEMDTSHIDAKPFGDLAQTFADIFFAWPEMVFKLYISTGGSEELVLDFQRLRLEAEEGLVDLLKLRKHIYEVAREELKKIDIG